MKLVLSIAVVLSVYCCIAAATGLQDDAKLYSLRRRAIAADKCGTRVHYSKRGVEKAKECAAVESSRGKAGKLCFANLWDQTGQVMDVCCDECKKHRCPDYLPAYFSLWEELSGEQKAAANNLGYSEFMWKHKGHPQSIEYKSWDELSDDQHDNLGILGYNQGSWMSFYNSYFYGDEDVSEEIWAAVKTLGYNEKSWNTCYVSPCVELEKLFWSALSPTEKAAAHLLGYECRTWDHYFGPTNREEDCEPPPFKRRWKSLPMSAQGAAMQLGYDEFTWDNDDDAAAGISYPDTWEELTNKQKQELSALGYNEGNYNGYWDSDFYWIDLPERIRDSISSLITEQEWNNCNANYMHDCIGVGWNELTTEQQESVGILGYTCDGY